MTMRFQGLLLGCVMLSAVGFAPHAVAQDDATKAQAREQFNHGIEQYEASQYDAALESFQEAYRLSPHPMVRVNMANCYDRLGKPVEALFHFERFLSETEGDASRAAQRSEVQSAIRRLNNSVGVVNLRVIPDGSQVSVDETEARRSPITEPIRLAAGDHVVKVSKPGFVATERRIQVHGGASESVNITLEREAVASVIAPTPAPVVAPLSEEEPRSTPVIVPLSEDEPESEPAPIESRVEVAPLADAPSRPLASEQDSIFTPPVIIASVVSGTLLVGGVLMGLGALKANADFESFSAQSRNPAIGDLEQESARRAAFAAADRADGRALTADILFAGALISGAAAAFFILTQDDADESGDVALRLSPTDASLRVAF